MIRPKRLSSACLLWPLLAPASAQALVVEIQGARLEIQVAGSSCVEIAGSYPGVRIEASEAGKTPRICYNSNRVNSITLLNTAFIATAPLKKDILVKFEHDFPSGINGKIMARAKLQGFFSTHDGIGVASGDKVSFLALFGQTEDHADTVGEPFGLTAGEEMDSAMFDYSAKEQYLISGPRLLQGVLTLSFEKTGHRLTLEEKSGISLDTGSTMADKLELMEPEPTEEDAATKPASPSAPDGKKQEPPAEPPQKQKKELPAGPAQGKKKSSPAEPAQGQKPDLPLEPPAGATPFTSPP
jgi:hypothetical protein